MVKAPAPGGVQQISVRKLDEAAAKKTHKAQRRAENERNRAAKLARQARLALPPGERLAAATAGIDAKWAIPKATVDAEEVKAAQRAAMTRIEVVREITVEVPAPPLPAGSYTECEVCVGRGMRDRYGQVPAAAERLALIDTAGIEVAVIETCPTHVPYVEATARRRGFTARKPAAG